MEHVPDLSTKLALVLKAASLSRVALAQQLGVDKSLVGRWLAGTVHPTEHNLARLTGLVGTTIAGFRLADWFEPVAVLADRLGVTPVASAESHDLSQAGPLAAFLDATRPELAHRGAAYEGFWRTSRPSMLMPDRIFHDYGMMRRNAEGFVEVSMLGSGLDFSGWLFPTMGNVFVFLFDSTGRTPMVVQFKGVSLPKAMVLDGILLMSALDSVRTPAAVPIVIERVGDLSGDRALDEERLAEIVRTEPEPADPIPPDTLRTRLLRDVGPAAAAQGGPLFLAVEAADSLSRAVTTGGLTG